MCLILLQEVSEIVGEFTTGAIWRTIITLAEVDFIQETFSLGGFLLWGKT